MGSTGPLCFTATLRSVVVLIVAGFLPWGALTSCTENTRVAPTPMPTYRVGLRQVSFIDDSNPQVGARHLALNIFYPAQAPGPADKPFPMPFFTNLDFYRELPPVLDGHRHPLILFSHGRGSTGLQYAWFAQALASRGYVVAALNHYRANTYDSSIEYLTSKLWQRPKDLTLTANFIVGDSFWGRLVDPERIGVAGHSQGGFTSLWIGGARVNAEKFLSFQQGVKNNLAIPADIRDQLPLDAAPALDVADPRIKAVFAMAPGVLQDFGMDAAGLHQVRVPSYITVGAHDTQTPPKENAEFAAANISGAKLNVLPGDVDHEVFGNECNQRGRDEFPEACIDAPRVNRHAIHTEIAEAAAQFFATAFGS
ncbi:hypothetical protein MHAE_05712 [Mycobacterium haemophilum DSM 44634]|uniref:alpha/beta hydrolase family protein n=1 Tax=Mycobacterium haemophilum TaxID=29311 RepID=UPI0006D3DF5E|nr:lipoprotein signal peptide [Mycobacterium haemophilum DSM 44634]